jgi:uncharacterized protein YdaU (DUF1376 family)
MKRPWFPFYPADYLSKTQHLSTEEHGAYLLLLMYYWTHGKLPSREDAVAKVTRLESRAWAKSRGTLKDFFFDGWKHKRMDEEIAKAIEISTRNSANAKRRHVSGRLLAPHTSHSTYKKEQNGIRAESKEVKSSIKVGFSAYPDSDEFKKWKAWAFERNVPLWRVLQQRELENRPFDFETQWPL